jgi:hypothetical protein
MPIGTTLPQGLDEFDVIVAGGSSNTQAALDVVTEFPQEAALAVSSQVDLRQQTQVSRSCSLKVARTTKMLRMWSTLHSFQPI